MNTTVTSKQEILNAAKAMVAQEGIQAITMRQVAKACGIAVGSLYNYFPAKSDLTLATVEAIWQEVFHGRQQCAATGQNSFLKVIEWLFGSIKQGAVAYPGFLIGHPAGFGAEGRAKGRHTMRQHFAHMKMGLLQALQQDSAVRQSAFTPQLTQEQFIGFVFDNILAMLVRGEESCGFFLEIVRRTIY